MYKRQGEERLKEEMAKATDAMLEQIEREDNDEDLTGETVKGTVDVVLGYDFNGIKTKVRLLQMRYHPTTYEAVFDLTRQTQADAKEKQARLCFKYDEAEEDDRCALMLAGNWERLYPKDTDERRCVLEVVRTTAAHYAELLRKHGTLNLSKKKLQKEKIKIREKVFERLSNAISHQKPVTDTKNS